VPSERQIQSVIQALYTFSDEDPAGLQVCAILDGASVPGLTRQLDSSDIQADCLYRGDLDADTAVRAPYLVRFSGGSDPFLRWILEELSDRHWGIFATVPASVSFEALRRHFRRFLKVKSPVGETLLFRYYDPRVLRIYLPTCLPDEWEFVYGPVLCFHIRNEDGSGYQSASYSTRNGFAQKALTT
jgi:hypothetical protein